MRPEQSRPLVAFGMSDGVASVSINFPAVMGISVRAVVFLHWSRTRRGNIVCNLVDGRRQDGVFTRCTFARSARGPWYMGMFDENF